MKQIIIVNSDIQMSAGKLAAQVAHASVGAILDKYADQVSGWNNVCDVGHYAEQWWSEITGWSCNGETKIVLKAPLEELNRVVDKLRHLPNHTVVDEGRTELEPGTITCAAIGPSSNEDLRATRHLALY